jgi:hypothetical protein
LLFNEWIGQDDAAGAANRSFPHGLAPGAQLFLFALFAPEFVSGPFVPSSNRWSTIAKLANIANPAQGSFCFAFWSVCRLPSLHRTLIFPADCFVSVVPLAATSGLPFTEALKLALRIPCPLKKSVFLPLSPTCCFDQPVPELLNR